LIETLIFGQQKQVFRAF